MTVLTLDRLPDNAPDGDVLDWVAHVVLEDGSVHTAPVGAFDRPAGTCTLDSPLTSDPLSGAVCVLENTASPSTLWRVLSVRETGGPALEFLARQYDPGRYAAAETGFKLDTPALELPQGPIPSPASVSLRERQHGDGSTTESVLGIGVEDAVGGRDTRAAGIEVRLGRTMDGDTHYRPVEVTDAAFAEVTRVRPGTYRASARYVAHNSALRSPWTVSNEQTVAGIGVPDGFDVTAVPGGYTVAWDAPLRRDYAYTEILERKGDTAAEVVGRSAASPWPRLGLGTTERHVSLRHVDRAGRRTNATAEVAVTPLNTDAEAAKTAARASAAAAETSATQAREAVAGIDDTIDSEVDSRLDTELAPAIVLRGKSADAARLEPAQLSDLTGSPATAQIDAGALRLGDDFEASADGRLTVSPSARTTAPLWGGSMEVPADDTIVALNLTEDMRSYDVIKGTAINGESPYAAVRIALIVPGALPGTAASRPDAARLFAVVPNAAAATRVYYWRSADGRTLYLQNDTAGGMPPAVRLLSLMGVRNPGVPVPPAPTDLIVSPPSLTVREGGTARFNVRLSSPPTGTVRVTARETDSDISVSPAYREFTTSDWNSNQEFTVTGMQDADTANDAATVSLAASGGGYDATATVNVDIRDDATPPIVTRRPDSIYLLAETTPERPTGGTTVEDHEPPGGWDNTDTQPTPTDTNNVYRCTRTETLRNGVFQIATAWSAPVKVADKTGPPPPPPRNDFVYRLSGILPSTPTGGTMVEDHTPSGWTRVQPASTLTQKVYRAERNETFLNGVFESATAWGGVKVIEEMRSDYCYLLDSRMPSAPTGGTTVEDHEPPGGWDNTDTQPTPTDTNNVYRCTRTETLRNGVFQFATAWSAPVKVADKTRPNQVPNADAGPNQTVNVGDTVYLDGSGSTDAEGAITYRWYLLGVNQPSLTNANTATASFTAQSNAGSHIARLTVTDEDGSTDTDDVLITVVDPNNQVPNADAGPNQTVNVGDTVYLDGSGSTDAEGAITYRWYLLGVNQPSLTNANTATASFTAQSNAGSHIARLTVTDEDGSTDTDDVLITVVDPNNQLPNADAGPNQTVNVGDTVYLDGSGSTDAEGAITYRWYLLGVNQPSLTNANTATASFTAQSNAGSHIARLTVTDEDGSTDTDDVLITVLDV